MNLFLTVDIISGVGCLIMAVLMHFSEIGCLREETNMRRGRTMVELLLLLVGVLTLVTGLGGEKYYEILKAGLIQGFLPLTIFLFSWAILYAMHQDENLDRIMWRQLMIVLLVLSINVVYWIFADEGLQTYFYYILSFVNIIVLVYYAYFFSQTILKYKLKHPHAYPSLRWMIGLEKVGLYGVCSLSVLVNFWLDRRLFLVFTFLYTLLFIILVLLYHNHEVIWALHSLTKRYQKIPNKDKETKKSIPSATSVHTGRQTILNNDKIAERVAEWVNNHGYRQASITIKILSKELGINRTYLSNFINEVYGTNFNGWINELRVKEAKSKMCESPELSLSEIADFVGFADSAHFSKQFKQNEGVSPSVWRKNKIRDKEK